MSDQVFLEGLQFYAFHGVNPEERALGQRFLLDLVLETDLRIAAASDDIDQTVSYSAVYRRIKGIIEGAARNLMESVAGEVAEAILADFPRVSAVDVTVRKPEVPMKGVFLSAAGVRLRRTREQVS